MMTDTKIQTVPSEEKSRLRLYHAIPGVLMLCIGAGFIFGAFPVAGLSFFIMLGIGLGLMLMGVGFIYNATRPIPYRDVVPLDKSAKGKSPEPELTQEKAPAVEKQSERTVFGSWEDKVQPAGERKGQAVAL